jgi:predicted nicotinamide N-methyase
VFCKRPVLVWNAEREPKNFGSAEMDDSELDMLSNDSETGSEQSRAASESLRAPDRLLSRSDYRGPVEVSTLLFGGTSIRLARPAEPDRLLDDPSVIDWNRRDDYMPYWAYLWPSALLVADWVASEPLPARPEGQVGPNALEIGCGLGLPGLVAVARGLRVQFSDHDPAPLEFVDRSAAENRFSPVHYSIRHLDWRYLPDERFSIILGADVLYELRLVPLVARLLSRLLAPDGVGVIASPFRAAAQGFPAALADVGLTYEMKSATARSPAGQTIKGTIYHVRRPASTFTSRTIARTSLSI